jgi:hypothetical protein
MSLTMMMLMVRLHAAVLDETRSYGDVEMMIITHHRHGRFTGRLAHAYSHIDKLASKKKKNQGGKGKGCVCVCVASALTMGFDLHDIHLFHVFFHFLVLDSAHATRTAGGEAFCCLSLHEKKRKLPGAKWQQGGEERVSG